MFPVLSMARAVSPSLLIAMLASSAGIIKELDGRGQVMHSYPFCWRSDTPLIYRAIQRWFLRVANIIPQLLAASAESRWVQTF